MNLMGAFTLTFKNSRRMALITARLNLFQHRIRKNWLRERDTLNRRSQVRRETHKTLLFGRTVNQMSLNGPVLGVKEDLDGILNAL